MASRLITHKATGWTREAVGFGNWRIVPTDESGARTVAFMSAGDWGNLPNDDRAHEMTERVVLIDGPALPAWAVEWLTVANAKSCRLARERFQAALDDADWNEARRDADSY
jgi:hypothetical protein